MGKIWSDGYSAHVEIYLLVDGNKLDVAQVGNGSLILRQPQEIAPGTPAKLAIVVDGKEDIDDIVLCQGANKSDEVVFYL